MKTQEAKDPAAVASCRTGYYDSFLRHFNLRTVVIFAYYFCRSNDKSLEFDLINYY